MSWSSASSGSTCSVWQRERPEAEPMSDNHPMPPGFPLPAVDSQGQSLSAGDLVTITKIPDWLIDELSEEDVTALRAVEGTNRPILRFDEYGYAWFGDRENNDWFCLRPEEVKRSAH